MQHVLVWDHVLAYLEFFTVQFSHHSESDNASHSHSLNTNSKEYSPSQNVFQKLFFWLLNQQTIFHFSVVLLVIGVFLQCSEPDFQI